MARGMKFTVELVTIDIEIYLWYSSFRMPKTAIFLYSTMFFSYDHELILRHPVVIFKGFCWDLSRSLS